MAKYAVWTKWHWPNGVGSAEQMQDGMKGIKADHPAEDIIWWHIDGNHHMSVVIYKTEEEAKAHLEWRKNHRAETVRDYDVQLLEEQMGPVAAQMSARQDIARFFRIRPTSQECRGWEPMVLNRQFKFGVIRWTGGTNDFVGRH